jgi:uncharacterized protein
MPLAETHDHARPSGATAAADKEVSLKQWLIEQRSALIGFSGGVDSTYLACVALETLGPSHVLAVTGVSASLSSEQSAVARDIASQWDLPWLVIETDELDDPQYAANPTNRCYFCKHELWSKLVPIAQTRGYAVVVDGTNADDLADYRPGARAAREQGVCSPLAIVGLTKGEIRIRSRARGLPTWNHPSAPCLASRLPYGTPVTTARLRRVETAEAALRSIGVSGDLRVRDHGDMARVELSAASLSAWLSASGRRRIAAALKPVGYTRIAIDLAGFRSGSLNVLAGIDAA